MTRTSLPSVAALIAAAVAASPSHSQDAARSTGPLIEVARSAQIMLSVSDLPDTTPNAPVDYWEWHFLPLPRAMGGMSFDTLAVRQRIDCSARTMQALSSELYLNGTFVFRTGGSPSQQIAADTLADHVITIVCTPSSRLFTSEHPNWRLARESADLWFMDQ